MEVRINLFLRDESVGEGCHFCVDKAKRAGAGAVLRPAPGYAFSGPPKSISPAFYPPLQSVKLLDSWTAKLLGFTLGLLPPEKVPQEAGPFKR